MLAIRYTAQVKKDIRKLARQGKDLTKLASILNDIAAGKALPARNRDHAVSGHGSIIQPRLNALRYPMLKEGKMTRMVSMMIRTEDFLKAVGLSKCKAFKIICRGKDAESKGTLSEKLKEVTIALPSTEWVIQYE